MESKITYKFTMASEVEVAACDLQNTQSQSKRKSFNMPSRSIIN
jgi:hypothetical protein